MKAGNSNFRGPGIKYLNALFLQAVYITVTEKLDPGLDRESARKDIRSLLQWRSISVENRVFDGAGHIQDRFGLSWWVARIVSAALVADCRYC